MNYLSIILATQEVKVRRIAVQWKPGEMLLRASSQ
jgi:hypothetical protein